MAKISTEEIQRIVNEAIDEKITTIKNVADSAKQDLINARGEFNTFFNEAKSTVTATLNIITSHKNQADTVIGQINALLGQAKETEKATTEVHNSVKQTLDDVTENKTNSDDALKEIYSVQNQISTLMTEIKKVEENIKDTQDKINKLLGDANRASMAESFLKRKEELNAPINKANCWRNGGLVGLAIMIFAIMWYTAAKEGAFDYALFLSRLPLAAPLVWLVWNNSKTHSHLIRVQEEYAYKASVAMAYEGYNQNIHPENQKEIKDLLLQLAVANMGENPVRLFDKEVKVSPLDDENIVQRLLNKALPKSQKQADN